MGAGGAAGGADRTDRLALVDMLAGADVDADRLRELVDEELGRALRGRKESER